jgi:hypothetical protein
MVQNAVDAGHGETRARCATALRVHVARLAAGHDEEPNEDAEAGALIDARDAAFVRVHALRVEVILKAAFKVEVRGGDDGDG